MARVSRLEQQDKNVHKCLSYIKGSLKICWLYTYKYTEIFQYVNVFFRLVLLPNTRMYLDLKESIYYIKLLRWNFKICFICFCGFTGLDNKDGPGPV